MDVREAKELNKVLEMLFNLGDDFSIKNYEWEYLHLSEETEELLEVLLTEIYEQVRHCKKNIREAFSGLKTGISNHTLRKESIDSIEDKRKECVYKLAGMENPLERIIEFQKDAEDIREWIRQYAFQEVISLETRTIISIELCSNLIEQKYSLTEITNIVPWLKISDVFGLSIAMEKPISVPVTEDEKALIKEEYMATGKPEILKKIFEEADVQPGVVNVAKALMESGYFEEKQLQ